MTTRRKQIAGIVCLVIVLAIAWWTWQSFGPPPKIVVSRQTTYLTEPLAEDGLPHYGQALREARIEGVTPEDNGAVPFWQAMWPGDAKTVVSDQDRDAFAKELGIEPELLDATQRLELHWADEVHELIAWKQKELGRSNTVEGAQDDASDEQPAIDETEPDDLHPVYHESNSWRAWGSDLYDYAQGTPWKTDDIPPLADWLKRNQRQLDLLVEAAERPRWYSPSFAMLRGERWAVSQVLDFKETQAARSAYYGLGRRTMAHLGNGDLEAAWRDTRAILLLARHLAQDGLIVSELTAMAIRGAAEENLHHLLTHPDLTQQLARQIHADLQAMPPIPVFAVALGRGDRYMDLETLLQHAESAGRTLGLSQGFTIDMLSHLSVDLNIALPIVNEVTDLRVSAAEKLTARQREQAMLKVKERMDELARYQGFGQLLLGVGNRSVRSCIMSAELSTMTDDLFVGLMELQDRSYTELALIRLAAALAVYRSENGQYPATLDALFPDHLDEIPVDFFQEKPFVYQRTDDGFLLYSLGANGRDDGGSHAQRGKYRGYPIHEDTADSVKNLLGNQDLDFSDEVLIPPEADDISIRYPLPVAKFPEPPQTFPAE